MCGISGIYNLGHKQPIDTGALKRMIFMLRHRGPDEFGLYCDGHIGLAHARLSIIDLAGGSQPMHNEDKSVWVVFNGEIFNYLELRSELIAHGHEFHTRSDTEVLVHLYEEKGEEMFADLNGQFAFVIWDKRNQRILAGRDRFGIRPFFYTLVNGQFLFASEIKALFTDPRVQRQIDPKGLDQLFTLWATVPPRTVFRGILELAPGHCLTIHNKTLCTRRYWQLEHTSPGGTSRVDEEYYAERLEFLLQDSINLRLRADVPVAAYLSGGIDSSLISALVKKYYNDRLQTFSVSFGDKDYDEASYQKKVAETIKTAHAEVSCSYGDIADIMTDVVWFAEKPLIRTAPAPLYLLARLVRDSNIKVVLTGEGADEVLGGYDLFRENKIRRFWARYPNSRLRPLLMRRLYSYIPNWPRSASGFLEGFYRKHLVPTDIPHYSHIPRWEMTVKIKSLFSARLQHEIGSYSAIEEFDAGLPDDFAAWDSLAQAQYIEMQTLLSGNLLSSQGDRMMMANSVEGRLPFLDWRLVEFGFNLPAQFKLKVMKEKYLLKKISKGHVPAEVIERVKQAYRAPDAASFLHAGRRDYIDGLLSESMLSRSGFFDPAQVGMLTAKLRAMDTAAISARDNMALVAIVTTQLLEKLYIKDFVSRTQGALPRELAAWKPPA
ncbi:MAG: asparagine synthase (glutamine-hydrolyzing) [Candidatus Omnitrophica bacterium]|nr:asparagine synthase (glutamine-hydrolyzing) [Candidatus Omnitrophota bacterium]